MYQFRNALKAWDPKSGTLPKYQTDEFAEIIRRARKILSNRTASEIRLLQNHLDKALGEASFFLMNFEPDQTMDFITLQQLMMQVRDNKLLDLKKIPGKFTWAECYATLALGITASIANMNPNNDIRIEILDMSIEVIETFYQEIATDC